ncbi:50S ribosomal protein L2 [Candidatus Uhrbacteria bacterium]|nr:50S ribosomal protein L2 [Candidatus Uhrbacteria bacterium]
MGVKRYRPTTNGRRISSVDDFSDVTKFSPEKKLTINKKKVAGRTNGKITVRHHGGGARQRIRFIDSRREKFEIPARVVAIEYDPNRGARLALVHYADGEKRYIIAPFGLTVGATIVSSMKKGDIQTGNRFQLQHMPVGMQMYDIELKPGKGGQMVRGAGTTAQLMAVEDVYATVRLPSGEVRMVPKECMATLGSASNPDRRLIRWGKAGRMRHRGIRPTVRGKVMNPVDHPHGGGEGRNPIGLKRPKTPTGKPALGVKTRRRQASDSLIITRRKRGRFVGG